MALCFRRKRGTLLSLNCLIRRSMQLPTTRADACQSMPLARLCNSTQGDTSTSNRCDGRCCQSRRRCNGWGLSARDPSQLGRRTPSPKVNRCCSGMGCNGERSEKLRPGEDDRSYSGKQNQRRCPARSSSKLLQTCSGEGESSGKTVIRMTSPQQNRPSSGSPSG